MLRHPWKEQLLAQEGGLAQEGDGEARKDGVGLPRGSENLCWLEVYPENYMHRGFRLLSELEQLATYFPLTSHGVHLSLGGLDALQSSYLDEVSGFLARFDMPWWSDHIGTTIHNGEILHEILPVPFEAVAAKRLASRIRQAREVVGRPLLVENTAFYCSPPSSGPQWSETQFIAEVLSQSDGELLFDVNNCFVNANNHGVALHTYLEELPLERVREIHIGGFTVDSSSGLLIDSHAACPSAPVFRFLTETLVRTGPKPVLLEWESNFGDLNKVFEALALVQNAWERARLRVEGDA